MKVTGFTIIKNALKFDYPIKEAITSILPLCDNVVVSVGNSEDNTLDYIKSIKSEKINIIESVWDENIKTGGKILSVETNKAKELVSDDSDWLFYIQADESIHENDYDEIYKMISKYKNDTKIDGLLFKYYHFYGSYDYICDSTHWYRREIRIIRNNPNIYSYGDAQGFRKDNNKKLNVKLINAHIYHYGWVKHPKTMFEKNSDFNQLWSEQRLEKVESEKLNKDNINQKTEWRIQNSKEYDFSAKESLKKFEGTHPMVMKDRIDFLNWYFELDHKKIKINLIERLRRFIEKYTGWRIGEYKNYIIIK
jgi:hypothetical protein